MDTREEIIKRIGRVYARSRRTASLESYAHDMAVIQQLRQSL